MIIRIILVYLYIIKIQMIMKKEHRIDLPLSEEAFEKLAICKEHFKRATNTAAIRDVIAAYPEALKLIQELREKLEAEKAKNRKMNMIIGDLKSAIRNLQEF